MVIKSTISADVLNDYIALKHGESTVDRSSPQTWKYYLNISGQYHGLDTLMLVTSLDTLEEIAFTRDNLAVHTATAKAYTYGSRYYYSLLSRHPEQEQLILGVLYPVDITKAVQADEGTILGYPADLIEPQEQTLIIELEEFIKRHYVRWNVKAFGVSDSLYNTSYHAQLYLALLPKVLNLRLRRAKSSEAHSFHIREYLASNGGLDKYLPFMTLKQALFLYRNIKYLEKNTGQAGILRQLIQRVLDDRRIPIAEYSIRQLNEFDENFYPKISARRKPLNDQYNIAEKSYIDLDDLYRKEEKITYGTSQYYRDQESGVNKIFQTTSSSVIQTKNLESNMVDYNDAVPDTLEEVLMRQWVHLSTNALYDVVINFKDPKTSQVRSLYAKDAFIYMLYVSLGAIGIHLTHVPSYVNLKFRRSPKPSVAELMSVVDHSIEGIEQIAQDIWAGQPNITRCSSTSIFFQMSYQIFDEAKRHWYLLSNAHDVYRRAAVNAMVLKLYGDEHVSLSAVPVEIDEWLAGLDLPVYNFTPRQAQEYAAHIFTSATGIVSDETRKLKNIQHAMLSLLADLSSYTIQYIREINVSEIHPLNWAAIRGGGMKYGAQSDRHVPLNVRVSDKDASVSDSAAFNSKFVQIQSIQASVASLGVSYRSALSAVYAFQDVRHMAVAFRSFTVYATYAGHNPLISAQAGYIGKEQYLALSDEQKNQLISIYN